MNGDQELISVTLLLQLVISTAVEKEKILMIKVEKPIKTKPSKMPFNKDCPKNL